MAKKKSVKVQPRGKDDSKIFAFLATFLSIIGFIIALIAKKDDKYVMFYAKQSLVLFIASIVLGIIAQILLIIPLVGSIIYWVVQLIVFVLWVVSWVYALSGDMKEVPIVGQYAEKFNF